MTHQRNQPAQGSPWQQMAHLGRDMIDVRLHIDKILRDQIEAGTDLKKLGEMFNRFIKAESAVIALHQKQIDALRATIRGMLFFAAGTALAVVLFAFGWWAFS